MRIRLAFSDDDVELPGDMPLLVSAVDEYTEENWGKVPDWYRDDLRRVRNVREVNIEISDDAVRELFAVPTIHAKPLWTGVEA